jgi:hypothetical protein
MSTGATYCRQYQPTFTSHVPDNHTETMLKIVYYSVLLNQFPNLVQVSDLGHTGMQEPSNVHILRQVGFEYIREIPCQFL